ncbi:MAG: AAA family ATPase [Caldilineaceae bacterium SB0661_bin_34]|nr:AAA family ATPase [Caldilineaceae bacterium SB0661_bin_34]
MSITAEQQLAITSMDRNQSVMAGAGTGKTLVLVQRFLHVLEHKPDWPLRSVAAVTFTKAAAMSMRQRIRREIRARADCNPGVWRHRLDELDALQVATVHSFCQRFLTEHAVEAGIDPDFAVADETEASSLLDEAVRRYSHELDRSEPPESELVVLFRPAVFRQVLADLLTKEHLMVQLEASGSVEGYLRKAWEAAHAEVEAAVTAEIMSRQPELAETRRVLQAAIRDPDVKGALGTRCGWALGTMEHLMNGDWIRARAAFNAETWPKSIRDVGGGKMGPDFKRLCNKAWRLVHETCNRLERVRAGSVGEEPDQQDRKALRLLGLWHSAWKRANRHLDDIKRERNLLTFDDLELKALHLLKVHAAQPASRVGSAILGINHLLVDEYQDINPLQQEIIGCLAALTGHVVAEGRRQGRLFAVGDTKQSIYRFRGAEVSEFVKLAEGIRSRSAQPLGNLSESFRTHRELIAATNAIFDKLFRPLGKNGYQDYEAKPMALRSGREAPARQPSLEVHTFSQAESEEPADAGVRRRPSDDTADAKRVAEFDLIASRLREIRESGRRVVDLSHPVERDVRSFRYSDAAILLRARTHLSLLEEVLHEHGVPFRVVDGTDLKVQAHIRSVVALLRWLHRSSDHFSLAAALRSPLFGLSDETLFLLAGNPAHAGLSNLDGAALSIPDAEQQDRVRHAHRVLSTLRGKALVLSPDWLLAEVLCETGYESVLLGNRDTLRARDCLDDLESLQWLAFQCRTTGMGEFLRRLAAQDRQANQREGGTEPEDGEAVQIMTVHGAKGLEFPVVFVPNLEYDWARAGPRHRPPVLAFNPNNLVCKVPDENGELAEPFSFQLAKDMEARRQHAESRRLFYVACTRAADLLVLSGWDTKKDSSWSMELADALAQAKEQEQEDPQPHPPAMPLFATATPVIQECWHECDLADYRDLREIEAAPWLPASTERPGAEPDIAIDLKLAREPAVANSLTVHAKAAVSDRVLPESPKQQQRGDLAHGVLGQWHRWFPLSEDDLMDFIVSRLSGHPMLATADARDIHQCLLRLRELPFGKRIRAARRLVTEMPMSVATAEGARNLRLDLLFQDERGDWHIVDWKTGDWSRRPDAARKVFRKQMGEYVRAVAEAFNGVRPTAWLGLLEPEPTFVELTPEELEPAT